MPDTQPKPTVAEVRAAYIDRKDFEDQIGYVERRGDEAAGAEFDRWLVENDARVVAAALQALVAERADVEQALRSAAGSNVSVIDLIIEHVTSGAVRTGAGESEMGWEALRVEAERRYGYPEASPRARSQGDAFQAGAAWALLAARGAVEPTVPSRCLQRDDTGHDVCDQPARYVVWGHLYQKPEKGPRCGRHLPKSAYLPQTEGVFANHAIYEIPARGSVASTMTADQVDTPEALRIRIEASVREHGVESIRAALATFGLRIEVTPSGGFTADGTARVGTSDQEPK